MLCLLIWKIFENERIKSTFKNLKKYDVVFNDINLFKNNKIYKKYF